MAKILITSIGSGIKDEKDKSIYKNTNYYLKNKDDVFQTPYVFKALEHFNNIDKCILIGTCGSDWFSLYDFLFKKTDTFDEHYSNLLYEMFTKYRGQLPTDSDIGEANILLNKLKNNMGDFYKEIILLKYGLDNNEHIENFGLLNCLVDYIDENDEIYFDITHSFRSLPMYELLTIEYLKATKQKNFKIGLISYGMFEIAKSNGDKAPIVDMTQIIDILEWIKAVEEFNKFGTAYLLQELLDKNPDMFDLSKEERDMFRFLGDAISINQTKDFKKLVLGCDRLIKRDFAKGKVINNVVEQIFKNISVRFRNSINDDTLLLLELALWNLEKKRYLNGGVIAIEGVLLYIEKITGISRDVLRVKAKETKTSHTNMFVVEFLELYNSIRIPRNHLCHLNIVSDNELNKFIKDIRKLRNVYKSNFKNKSTNEKDLKDAFLNKN